VVSVSDLSLNQRIVFLSPLKNGLPPHLLQAKTFPRFIRSGTTTLILVHVNVKRVPEPWFNIDATSLVEPATCTCTAAQHLRAESNKNTVSYESENVKIPRASLINSWLFFSGESMSFLMTDFINFKFNLTQSFEGAHKDKIYMCVFT
jgi:hypothetical protein